MKKDYEFNYTTNLREHYLLPKWFMVILIGIILFIGSKMEFGTPENKVLFAKVGERYREMGIAYLERQSNQLSHHPMLKQLYRSLWNGSAGLSFKSKKVFIALGVLHLAVVSGLHILLLFSLVRFAFLLPVRVLTATGLVSSGYEEQTRRYALLVAVLICVAFGWLIGFPPPCQRAILFLILSQFTPHVLYIRFNLGMRLLLAALVQFLLFSETFFSFSNYLSWMITIIIISQGQRRGLDRLIMTQLYIYVFCVLTFSQLSVISIGINLVGAFVFPIFLWSLFIGVGLFSIFGPLEFYIKTQSIVLESFTALSEISTLPTMSVNHQPIQWCMLILMMLVIMNDLIFGLQNQRMHLLEDY